MIDTLIWSMLIIFILLTFILIGIIFYLLSHRRFKIKNINVELEDFLNLLMSNNVKSYDDTQGVIENFISRLDEHNSDLQKTRQGLDKFVSIIQKELKSMDEHIGSIQDLTLQKEEKIRRFEDGYDNKIITQFTKELFNILEFIKKERKINDFASLKEIEEDLLLLLENNGIYKTNIQENDHYEEYIKLAKIVGSHITDSEQLNASIKEVVREGYYIELDKNKRALKIAEVIVNKYQRNVDV